MLNNPRAIAPPGSALSPMTCASACLAVPRGKRSQRVLAEKLRRCDAPLRPLSRRPSTQPQALASAPETPRVLVTAWGGFCVADAPWRKR